MFEIDKKTYRDLASLERKLGLVASSAVPMATRDTLNMAAFDARQDYLESTRKEFTLRNRWTERGIRFEKTRSLDINRQESRAGSVSEYMSTQESGGNVVKNGAVGVSIPTGYSAGQEGQKPRTRLPRASNRIDRIRLSKNKRVGVNRAQRNAIAVKQAAKKGQNKFIYMELRNNRKGIFRVIGGARRPKVKMVQDLSRTYVRIEPTHLLESATDRTVRRMPDMYRKALNFRLKKLRRV